ncbi:MAG: P-II family nitrogen regulator [Eggerthellaceae bacterium]|jgi:nitrogen regulatory protein PII|nr:P-II family nitrogen regulator [Eggerthellaceae bacterium]
MAGFSLICCIANDNDGSKVLKIAHKYGVKGGTISLGKGTGSNHLLDLLGLDETHKEIVTMIVENELASAATAGISQEMAFHKPHHGIAFSLSVSEFIGRKNIVEETPTTTSEVKDIVYQIIYVIVDKGQGEDVIVAANTVGAKGGTIMNARGAGIHEVQKLFSVEIEPEKEEVAIIVKAELKDNIVSAIKEHLKIDEPGNGILFVMDINEAYGLR